MRLGLISDIHAHLQDLERALAILDAAGADKVLCAGDLVEKGPRGDAVVALLNARCIPCVRGNHGDNALRHARKPDRSGEKPLALKTLAALAALPQTRSYLWEGQRILLAHGTPDCPKTYVFPDKVPKQLKRRLRRDDCDILILGHSHRPMDIRVGAVRVVNPGSVRGTKSRDSHSCAILDLTSGAFELYDLKTGALAGWPRGPSSGRRGAREAPSDRSSIGSSQTARTAPPPPPGVAPRCSPDPGARARAAIGSEHRRGR